MKRALRRHLDRLKKKHIDYIIDVIFKGYSKRFTKRRERVKFMKNIPEDSTYDMKIINLERKNDLNFKEQVNEIRRDSD